MASQTEPREVTNTGGGINEAPFNTTNPFGASSEHDSRHQTSSPERESYAESSSLGAGSEDEMVHRSGSLDKPATHTASHDSTMMEKIKTAKDAPTHETMDKIKTKVSEKFHLHDIRATGAARGFNPTTVRAQIRFKDDLAPTRSHDSGSPDISLLWRSRDNRKGRNSLAVPRKPVKKPFKDKAKVICRNVWKMFTTFPYYDMAFWGGWSYSIGSALFVTDGLFSWLETAFDVEFAGQEEYAIPLAFFIGALFYQIGAVAAYLEAINDGSFHGSAMRRLLEGHGEDQKRLLDEKLHGFFGHFVPHLHHHKEEKEQAEREKTVDPEAGWKALDRRDRPGSIYPIGKKPAPRRGGLDLGEAEEGDVATYYTWKWWPTWHELRTHHLKEIGYCAVTIQLVGVTLYGVTAIIIFPGIMDTLDSPWKVNLAYWIPQMIAAMCFLVASIMFTLEVQEKWWKPEPTVIGWWVGVWSIIGSVGFELCAAFGPKSGLDGGEWAQYQSELSSTWGSAAYLVGSLLQWYEATDKRPAMEDFTDEKEREDIMKELHDDSRFPVEEKTTERKQF